jgi:archaellum component FlaF (FlaF/FlaG flagellin family)
MKFGHLLFPALFFLILITGAFWIMRTVEEVSNASLNQTVYLESSNRIMEVTAETVGSTREKAHQAFVRFAGPLVENDVLSLEEQENLNQILKLGEGHWW